MFYKLFIITGVSTCGKTVLLNSLLDKKGVNLVKVPKYSSRQVRDKNDDIVHDGNITKESYDFVYKLNGNTYGIKLAEIKRLLNQKKNLGIVISDFHVIREIKKVLKESVVIWYISAVIDEKHVEKVQAERDKNNIILDQKDCDKFHTQFLKLSSAAELKNWKRLFECMEELIYSWAQYLPEAISTQIRKIKIRDFHKSYIDHISFFDHVIINRDFNNQSEMTKQAINILDFYKTQISKPKKESPAIFIISAASGSGKGMLMESIGQLISKKQIKISSKEGKREQKESDRIDGMRAIGINGTFSKDFNISWTFHKGEYFEGTEYAVNEKEIRCNLNQRTPQIFISNMQQIERFKTMFGRNAVFLYLHATRSKEDIRNFQKKRCTTEEESNQRIEEIEEVYKDFIDNITAFDHVLLNTTFPEDLYEQMFTLIDYYNDDL